MTANISLIDWLAFSLPKTYAWTPRAASDSVHPVLTDLFGEWFDNPMNNTCGEFFGDTQFQAKQSRGNWYHERHAISSLQGNQLLNVYLHPRADRNRDTSAYSVTGYALSNRPDSLQRFDPVELIGKIHDAGGKLTRIDLALDYLGTEPVFQYMLDSSKPDIWKDRLITPLRFDKPIPVGWEQETLYYGLLSKTTDTAVCVYDKAKEQGVPGPWLRVEFRTKDRDLCQAIMEEIVTGRPIGELTAGLLRKYLRFVSPGIKAKYNRPTAVWWDELLGTGEKFNLTRHRDGKTDEERKAKKPKSGKIVIRYLQDAFSRDDTGGVFADVAAFMENIQKTGELRF